MKRSRKLMLLVPASALVALAAWLLSAGRAPVAPANAAPAAEAPSAADKAAHADAKKLREVQDAVSAGNHAAADERKKFEDDGWAFVNVAPPDHQVVNFDPSLLDKGREHDLRMQLMSTVPSPESVRRVEEIARRAKDEATRYAAVEAMGRLNDPSATAALYDLLVNGGLDANDEARQQIAPLLRPAALDDPMTAQIAALLDSPSLSSVEKQEIAFTLALIGLRDGMTLDPSLPLSADARNLFAQATALAQTRFVKALDRKGGNP
jgi:hypothetical protein